MHSLEAGVSYVQPAYNIPPHCAVRLYVVWRQRKKESWSLDTDAGTGVFKCQCFTQAGFLGYAACRAGLEN